MRVLLLLRRRTDAAALPIQLGYTAPRLLPGTTPFGRIRSQGHGVKRALVVGCCRRCVGCRWGCVARRRWSAQSVGIRHGAAGVVSSRRCRRSVSPSAL